MGTILGGPYAVLHPKGVHEVSVGRAIMSQPCGPHTRVAATPAVV